MRCVALDLIRLAAVVLVLGRHLPSPPSDWSGAQSWFFDEWKRGGWVGVDLFFVLSGFLVSGLLFSEYRKHGQLSMSRFLVRRGLKIYPAFFLLILVTVPMTVLLEGRPGRSQIASEVFFLQSYVPGIWNHTWSLSVEEHFYLLLPMLLMVLVWRGKGRRDPFWPLIPIVAVIACVLLAARILLAQGREYSHLTSLYPTHLRIDSLLFGVLISYAFHFQSAWCRSVFTSPRRRWLLRGGLALFLPAFVFELGAHPFMYTGGLTLLYLAGGAILVGSVEAAIPHNPLVRSLAFIGSRSYSVYLWHLPVCTWGPDLLKHIPGVNSGYIPMVLTLVAASLLVGIAMAELVEYPLLRLRDRWYPSPTKASSTPIPAPAPDADVRPAATSSAG